MIRGVFRTPSSVSYGDFLWKKLLILVLYGKQSNEFIDI